MLPVVTRFLEAYSELSIGLVMTDRVAHLLEDQVDIALRIGPLPDSNLIATRLGAVRHVICANPDYLATPPSMQPCPAQDWFARCPIRSRITCAQDAWPSCSKRSSRSSVLSTLYIILRTVCRSSCAHSWISLFRVCAISWRREALNQRHGQASAYARYAARPAARDVWPT